MVPRTDAPELGPDQTRGAAKSNRGQNHRIHGRRTMTTFCRTYDKKLSSCGGHEFDYSVRDCFWRLLGFDLDPVQAHLSSEPCHLTLRELARSNLHQFDRLIQGSFSIQVLNHLTISQRLHRDFILCETGLDQLRGLGHQSVSEHFIDPGFNAVVQVGGGSKQPEGSCWRKRMPRTRDHGLLC